MGSDANFVLDLSVMSVMKELRSITVSFKWVIKRGNRLSVVMPRNFI